MASLFREEDIDLHQFIAKPLYFGLMTNIIIPMALLFVCYYINNNSPRTNMMPGSAEMLMYVFGLLAIAQAGVALWRKNILFNKPLIKSEDTFEADLVTGMMSIVRPIFIIIGAISIYGYLYFYITGRFQETVFFVIFSFLVFQVVRPRIGFARKLIQRQRHLVEKGEFRR